MNKKCCVVISGAGISADSGIPTFRGAGGLWQGYNVNDVATPEAFARDPQLVLDFYNQRRRDLRKVHPNPAHYALSELETGYDVRIITQNVDDLHERAGSSSVLHLHGELTKVRSCKNENTILQWDGDLSLDDYGPDGAPLRPHIVWFGEAVPAFAEAVSIVSSAKIVIVTGTSLQVYPAASLLDYAPYSARCFLVDPQPAGTNRKIKVIAKKAKDGIPELVEQLLAEV